jgi:hypothetical protein
LATRAWVAGSAVFADAEGQTFRWGLALRQYFIDRDGNPVLTADGQPVHRLVDQQRQQVLDGEGRPLIGPVEIPPGCQIRTYHQRGSGSDPGAACVAVIARTHRLRSGHMTLTSCTPTTACDCGLMWERLYELARLRAAHHASWRRAALQGTCGGQVAGASPVDRRK